MHIVKKIATFIGLALLLGINFLGTEYLLYTLLIAKSKVYYPFFIIFIISISIIVIQLNKLKIFNTMINACLVLFSVLLV